MIEILPAINVDSFEEVVRRIRIAEPFARAVHIDVADGTFTKTVVWRDPKELIGFQTPLMIEVHIMVAKPDEILSSWLIPEVSRVIVHHEALKDVSRAIDACHAAGKHIGISVVPDTSWTVLGEYIGRVDMLHALAVTPGPSGQVFDERIIEKITRIREKDGGVLLEVDGGVQTGIARRCVHAGATHLVVGAALYGAPSFEKAFQELTNDVESR